MVLASGQPWSGSSISLLAARKKGFFVKESDVKTFDVEDEPRCRMGDHQLLRAVNCQMFKKGG